MWEMLKLGELISLEYGKGLTKRERDNNGRFPVYGSNGIVGSHGKYLTECPCIIVGRKGAAGEVHLATKNCWPIDTTYYVKTKIDVDIKFLFYLLKSLHLGQHDRSTAIPGLNRNDAYDLDVLFPPLPTQNRIVEKIEELFSDLDHGVENLKKAQQQLKTYRQAVLKDAFEGKLTKEWREQQEDLPTPEELLQQIKAERNAHRKRELTEWEKEVEQWEKDGKPGGKPRKPRKALKLDPLTIEELSDLDDLPKTWKWVKIDQIIDHDQYALKAGPFGSALKKEFYVEDGYKVYGQEQVIGGSHEIGDYYIDDEKFEELDSCKVSPRDILISLVGTVGKVLILPEEIKPGVINPRLVKISVNEDYYLPEFFKYFFESAYLKSLYATKAHGATMDILNSSIIKELPFPFLSKKEQKVVLDEIESRLSVVDQLEQTIKENLQKAEALRQSILKKAFSGELVKEEVQEMKTDEIEEVTPFQQIQMIGVLVDVLKEDYDLAFGEMALAKFLFLIDRIKKYQTGFRFKDWHWGPYDPDIKKRLTSKNGFFKRGKMSVIELNEKKKQLLKYHLPDQDKFEEGVNEVSRIIKKFQGKKRVGRQLELLATVCKVIENEGSAEFTDVIKGMKNWKVEKRTFKTKAEMFTEEEIQRCIEFVIKNKWEDKLISKNLN